MLWAQRACSAPAKLHEQLAPRCSRTKDTLLNAAVGEVGPCMPNTSATCRAHQQSHAGSTLSQRVHYDVTANASQLRHT
jgi:hypothetical protein